MFTHMNIWMIKKNWVKHSPYSHLGMEDITDGGYMYGKRVSKDFQIRKLGKYCTWMSKVIHQY